jgi:hypothetical protein
VNLIYYPFLVHEGKCEDKTPSVALQIKDLQDFARRKYGNFTLRIIFFGCDRTSGLTSGLVYKETTTLLLWTARAKSGGSI